MLCIVVVALMAFGNPTFAVTFFIPLMFQYAIFKDVQDTDKHPSAIARRHPLIGLPLWVVTSITIFSILTVAASYFSSHRFFFFGVCVAICVVQSIQGPILVKAGVTIPDTTEIEALGWILEKEFASEFASFEKAAWNADTDSRKAILSHIVFPLLPTLSSRLGHSPVNERSYLNCMTALTFTPRKASFRTNEAAIMLPRGWEALECKLRYGLPNHSKEESDALEREYPYQPDTFSPDDTRIVLLSRQQNGGG
jgi:hypothetical protein